MSSQSALYSSGSNNYQESALYSSGSNDEEIVSCFKVEGTIYGKFESGYLVSVQVGSEVLNGVLYHPEEQAPSSNAIVPNNPGRSRLKNKDPDLPRPKWNGYTFYYVEKLPMLKSLYPTKRREFTKMIAESWKNLSRKEKRVYKNYALEDKKRHKKEWKEYNERKMTASSCN